MGKKSKVNPSGGLVYSTQDGRMCPQCLRAVSSCLCDVDHSTNTGSKFVYVQREVKGRGGKAVTIIKGLPLNLYDLKELSSKLKRQCGVGGSVKKGTIEIQGDQRQKLLDLLQKEGYSVKFSGG